MRMNRTCKRACNAMRNVSLYVWTHSEPDSELAGKWHSEQAHERANFIAKITIADRRNSGITITNYRQNDDRR